MSAAMNWAKAELEWDVSNPWQSRRQSEPSGRGRWLTQEEAEQLLQAAARPKRLQRYPGCGTSSARATAHSHTEFAH
jgi:hypothetical protein